MLDTLPWYKSKIIVGALVSAVLKVVVLTGLIGQLAPDQEAAVVDLVLLVASFAGDGLAIGARITQKVAPAIVVKR